MTKNDWATAVFGSFDGTTSALGAIAGLVLSHAPSHVILVSGGGLAAAAALGMGAGEYLAEDGSGRLKRAIIMLLATFGGTILPVLPVALIGGQLGLLACGLVVAALTILIAEFRSRTDGRVKGYFTSTGLIVGAAGVAAVVAALLGVA